MSLTGEYAIQLRVITSQIGGVNVNRSHNNVSENNQPFTPVSLKKQKAAVNALSKYAFAKQNFTESDDLYAFLQQQRRGFNHFSSNEDPHIHGRWLNIHNDLLNHLLHKNVLRRMTDTKLYGNKYGIDAYLIDLTNAIFKDDATTSVHTVRQNLQKEYTKRLLNIVTGKQYDYVAKAQALSEVNRINKYYSNPAYGNPVTKAHRSYIRWMIDNQLNNN